VTGSGLFPVCNGESTFSLWADFDICSEAACLGEHLTKLEGLRLIDSLMSMLAIYRISSKCNLEFGCN
jgi:hypothetical protein